MDNTIGEKTKEKLLKMLNNGYDDDYEENVKKVAEKVVNDILKDYSRKNKLKRYSISQHEKNDKMQPNDEKIFIPRNSLLTDLFETPHIRTIYNIIFNGFILIFFYTLFQDYVQYERINIGFRLILISLENFHLVTFTWMCMQTISILPHFYLKLWANLRKNLLKTYSKAYDTVWICIYIFFQLIFMILVTFTIRKLDFNVVPSIALLTEMFRFMMKNHAYVRSTAPRVLKNSNLPNFDKYIYFLFAPTLLYRDSYPRTTVIRWKIAFKYFLEMIYTIMLTSYIIERYVLTDCSSFGLESNILDMKDIIRIIFNGFIPGTLFCLCGFYILLQCWLNAAAEVMRFADRRFYMDWWTQSNFSAFFRLWNLVVHEWLHAFIYKEFINMTGNRTFSLLSVFFISAVVHEYLLAFSFGFFYPLMFILFVFGGVGLLFFTRLWKGFSGNGFLWMSLIIGNGLLITGFSFEYFARINCTKTVENYYYDLLMPKSIFCNNIVLYK